jgi:hypothetical protein
LIHAPPRGKRLEFAIAAGYLVTYLLPLLVIVAINAVRVAAW